MEIISDLIKILLPAAISLFAIYLTVKAFLNKEFEKRLVDIKINNTNVVLPLRLQAYERMSLFLERISPHNLIVRLNDPSYNAGQFHQILLHEIREEYNHNLSQQVYMSDQAWKEVKTAMDEVISLINVAGSEVPKEAKSIELAKKIFDALMQKNEEPVARALKVVKDEIRQVF